jgi:hypothetical protein
MLVLSTTVSDTLNNHLILILRHSLARLVWYLRPPRVNSVVTFWQCQAALYWVTSLAGDNLSVIVFRSPLRYHNV